jgi:diguanylate cyclase (GGDEF)-like protein
MRALTAEDPRQRGYIARFDLGDPDGRKELDVLTSEQDALLALGEAHQESKRSVVWVVMGACATLGMGFAVASFLMVRTGQRALAGQSALLGSIFESIGDSVVVIDRSRRFVVANAAFRRVFRKGFARGWLAIDAAERQDAQKEDGTPLGWDEGPLPRALRGDHVDGLLMSLATDESRVWLDATSRPVLDEGGKVTAAVAVLRDVTRERRDRALLARQTEELRAQSLVDELTGLYNRRGFLLLAEQHARAAVRAKRPFTVLFADLNGLKAINDTYGHDEGDRALRRTAAVFKTTLRESDIVARLGGDEYVALLDGADEETFARVMERMHHEIVVDHAREARPFRLSVSIGAAFHTDGAPETIEQLIAIADKRMYAQKRGAHAPTG